MIYFPHLLQEMHSPFQQWLLERICLLDGPFGLRIKEDYLIWGEEKISLGGDAASILAWIEDHLEISNNIATTLKDIKSRQMKFNLIESSLLYYYPDLEHEVILALIFQISKKPCNLASIGLVQEGNLLLVKRSEINNLLPNDLSY